jgi:NADH-quinone oxidoreductase subunit M
VYLTKKIYLMIFLLSICSNVFILFLYYKNLISDTYILTYDYKFQEIYTSTKYTEVFSALKINLDIYGLIILIIAHFVALVSFSVLAKKTYWFSYKYIYICNFIVLVIYIFTSTTDIITFFISYELLLLPSVLFIYYVSPVNSSLYACIHFLVWTQIGSILVLIVTGYIVNTTNCTDFTSILKFNFSSTESKIIFFFLFVGFGCKIPIWPLYSWLLTTHVEAPTGFSIFLSGFLVKTAVYGFYKFTTLVISNVGDTSIYLSWCLLGSIDASLKLWNQNDLKKLIAYCTVQEMNLIYSCFIVGDCQLINIGFLFCVTHALLSTLFFFLVDTVYIRNKTRSLLKVLGLFKTNPKLAWSIFLSCIIFSGIPGSLKFICEISILISYFEISRVLVIIILFLINYAGILGFFKCWFSALFGDKIQNNSIKSRSKFDLTRKEFNIIFLCNFLLVILTYFIDWVY